MGLADKINNLYNTGASEYMLYQTSLAEQLVSSLLTTAKQAEMPLDATIVLPGLSQYDYESSEVKSKSEKLFIKSLRQEKNGKKKSFSFGEEYTSSNKNYRAPKAIGEVLHVDISGGILSKTLESMPLEYRIEEALELPESDATFTQEIPSHFVEEATGTIEEVVPEALVEDTIEDVVEDVVEDVIPEALVEEVVEEVVPEALVEEVVEEVVPEALVEEVVEDVIPEALVEEVIEDVIPEALVEEVIEDVIPEALVTTSNKSDEELWLEETGFGLNDIEMSSEEFEFDYSSMVEAPDDTETVPERQRVAEERVTLVVEQLIVTSNPETRVNQDNREGPSQQSPVRPVFPDYSAPQPISYSPAVPKPAPAKPDYSAPPMESPTYSPAPSVDNSAATQTPSQTDTSPPISDTRSTGLVQEPSTPGALALPTYTNSPVEEVSSNISPLEKPVEIRSDSTHIHAGTVSVSSSAPTISGLSGFDPRKYFTPNEISTPRLPESDSENESEAVISAEGGMPETDGRAMRPKVRANSKTDLSNLVAPSDNGSSPDDDSKDVQKMTQMFRELRSLRDR
jgi:hypothetical protein